MLRFCSLRGASSKGHGAHGLTGSWSEEEAQKMAMRLGIVCHVFPSCRTRLGSQRRFFSLSISRHHAHSHSVRHSLPSSETPGRERVLPGFRRRLPCRLQATASSSVDGEGEWEISEARAGRELDEDVGTSGQGMGPPRTGRVAGRGERRQVDWMRGWDDGLGVETGSEFDNSGGGRDRGRGGVRRTANGVDDRRDNGGARFRRSESGSQASSSDTRREAFSRFLHRGSRQEDQVGDSPEWEPGFYANDSRTSPAGTSSSPWSRLSKSLSEAPAQDSAGQGSGVGGRRQVSSSSVAPVKPDSGLPPLSKFFPDSIVNPFSNPPPARRGFFSQLEGDEDAAVEGRKLGEDLWGTRNPAARFASKSVGSRSVPSNPSIPGRYSKYSKKKSAGPPRMYSTSAPAAVDVPTKSSQVLETQPRQNPAPWLTEDSVEADVVVRPHLTEEATSPSKSVPSPGVTGPTFSTDVSPSEKPENSPPSQISAGDQSSVDKGVRSDEVHESFPSPVPTPLPFEFQYSYSEVPKVAPVKVRNQFSPFGPQTMDRPWTGKAPLKKSKKKNAPEFDSFKPPPQKKGIKFVQQPGPFPAGKGPKPAKTREEIIGEPLTKDEIKELVESCIKGNRQLNLGRDGLTHNMLDLVHSHWKRRRCIKIKCKGVPTVDMDNVCFHLEDKTGGLIIERVGGTVYLYRGRYYNYKDRPFIPLMLWKPLSPIYPKLIKAVPDGMTREEVHELRKRGRRITPLKKLNKNGVYMHLVQEVRDGFLFDDLVRLDCKGLNPSDYKKIGAKLKDLVPCVLLSFEKEQLLLWKGRDLEAIESQKHPVSDSSTPGTVDSEVSDDSDSGSDVELADESSVESDDFNVEAEQTVPDGAIAELDSVDSTLVVAELQSEQGLSEIEDKEEAGVKSDGESSNGSSTTGLPGNEPGERNPLDELWEGAIEAGTAVTLDQPESLDLDQLKEKAQTLYVPPPRTDTRHAKDKSRVKQKKTVEESSPIPFSSTPERGLPLDELAKLLSPEVN